MIARWCYLVLCIALAGNLTTKALADTRVEFDNGKLTVESRGAPLHQVIREIGEIVGFETVLIGDFSESRSLDVIFDNLAPKQALDRLVGTENRIIVYAQTGETGATAIAQVWLLQAGDTQSELALDDSQSIESGSGADVNGYKLARLTRMLQPEQAVVVRERAAMALAKFDDERAILALESALSDHMPSVRKVAISALGRINSELAAEALANFLRDDNISVPDRTSARSALARHDKAMALEILRTDDNDTDVDD